VGRQVLIQSSRYRGKYNGQQGAIASEPSAYGVKVDVGDGEPVFFLKDEVTSTDIFEPSLCLSRSFLSLFRGGKTESKSCLSCACAGQAFAECGGRFVGA
jgi:hypothetical protein